MKTIRIRCEITPEGRRACGPAGGTVSVLRETVMLTPAGRRWRRRYLKQLEARRLREARAARPGKEKGGAWGMSPGGKGYERERDEVKRHGVKVKSFKSDVKRKLRLRRAMQKEARRRELETTLKRRLRKIEAAVESARVRSAVAVFRETTAFEQEAAARRGDRELLHAARRAARFVEANASRSGLSAGLRRRIRDLRDEVAEVLKRVAADRGRGLGNNTSNLNPGDAESDGARGEISQLLKDAEGTRGAGKPDGMGGDSPYEDDEEEGGACEACGEAASECECDPELEEALGWDDVGMDADRAEGGDDDGDLDDGGPAIGETGEVGGDGEWRVDENYRYASDPARSCGTCKHFDRSLSECTLFESMVRAVDVCDAWEPAS